MESLQKTAPSRCRLSDGFGRAGRDNSCAKAAPWVVSFPEMAHMKMREKQVRRAGLMSGTVDGERLAACRAPRAVKGHPEDQKSNCRLSFAKRADITWVGVSQAPFGMNAWL